MLEKLFGISNHVHATNYRLLNYTILYCTILLLYYLYTQFVGCVLIFELLFILVKFIFNKIVESVSRNQKMV